MRGDGSRVTDRAPPSIRSTHSRVQHEHRPKLPEPSVKEHILKQIIVSIASDPFEGPAAREYRLVTRGGVQPAAAPVDGCRECSSGRESGAGAPQLYFEAPANSLCSIQRLAQRRPSPGAQACVGVQEDKKVPAGGLGALVQLSTTSPRRADYPGTALGQFDGTVFATPISDHDLHGRAEGFENGVQRARQLILLVQGRDDDGDGEVREGAQGSISGSRRLG